MEAAKAVDAYGLFPGHEEQQGDAEQAYTQSKLGGTETWIRLPRDQLPKKWQHMKDPVCPLVLALYGHPDSGGYWEKHCEKHLRSVGFTPIADWRSVFFHDKLKLLLAVYVDDFKMAGPKVNMKQGWDLIQAGIKMDTPAAVGKYLGCDHKIATAWIKAGGNPMQPDDDGDIEVIVMEYDMEQFLKQCVERYQELAGARGANLQRVATSSMKPLSPQTMVGNR